MLDRALMLDSISNMYHLIGLGSSQTVKTPKKCRRKDLLPKGFAAEKMNNEYNKDVRQGLKLILEHFNMLLNIDRENEKAVDVSKDEVCS